MQENIKTASKGKKGKESIAQAFLDSYPDSRTHTTKVTAKGQITVPKLIREHLKIAKGDRIEFLIGINGTVTIMPATADVRALKGMVKKPAKTVTVEDMNQVIEVEGGAIK